MDDTQDTRDVMRTMLEMWGHKVMEAVNGRDGVQMAFDSTPDVILMDLRMPVMDGFEATRTLRHYQQFNRVPILAMSAHCAGKWKQEALAAGCYDCINKPFDPEKLNGLLTRFAQVA
ncbi:MAG TPA: response regulator [Terriglobia bacterium]|nr:response regulator [Terriglobia bacterium]